MTIKMNKMYESRFCGACEALEFAYSERLLSSEDLKFAIKRAFFDNLDVYLKIYISSLGGEEVVRVCLYYFRTGELITSWLFLRKLI